MTGTLDSSTLEQEIALRLGSVDGQRRLARALYSIAVDLVDPLARYDLRQNDFDWLIGAVGTPVRNGTRAALDVLMAELCNVLAAAPQSLLTDLSRLEIRAGLGVE